MPLCRSEGKLQHDSVCIRKINGSFSGKKKKKKKLPTALNNSAEMSDSCSKKTFFGDR